MTDASLLPLLDDQLLNKLLCMSDGDLADQTFRLLRLGDLCISMAWRSTWHASEKTPLPTPCLTG